MIPKSKNEWFETIAAIFHDTYERLAPKFNYKTRPESAVAWEMVREENRRLMTATVAEIIPPLLTEQKKRDWEEFREMVDTYSGFEPDNVVGVTSDKEAIIRMIDSKLSSLKSDK